MPKRREVSCLALTFFYDFLEKRGIPRRSLQEGLAYSPAHLDGRLNWIDYGTFVEIERRVEKLLPHDADLFFQIGRSIEQTAGFGFLRVIIRATVSPYRVYQRIPGLVSRFLFPFVRIDIRRLEAGRYRARYEFDPRYPPTEAFLETVRGLLSGVPAMVGGSAARVHRTTLGPCLHYFDIALEGDYGGLVALLSDLPRRLQNVLRMRIRNIGEAADELVTTNDLLYDKVADLERTRRQLERTVHEKELLVALIRRATLERDPQRLLAQCVHLMHEELNRRGVAVLVSGDGAPRVAAFEGISPETMSALRERLEVDETLRPGPDESRETALHGRHWRLLPLESGYRSHGILVVEIPPDASENLSQLVSMATELALAHANAVAFQDLAELRDSLEERVEERTAQLEVARDKLEATVQRLREASAARTEFFTNVSHEFKTPLTVVLGTLEQLRDADLPPEDRLERLGDAQRNARSLLRLVEDLLDSARLDAGSVEPERHPLDLAPLCENVIAMLRPLARAAGQSLELVPDKGRTVVDGDPRLLRRVAVNLVENAIKHGGRGGPVEVRVAPRGDRVVLEVADRGRGIPQEEQGKIFERFMRARDTDGRQISGSGIGLALSRDIVNLHGGSIEVESAVDVGTTFRVSLPAADEDAVPSSTGTTELSSPEEPPEPLEPPPREPPDESGASLARARVAVVEDNFDMRRWLVGLLRPHFRVSAFEDGESALARIREAGPPDVLLSDVMMPGMSGFELCRALKADPETHALPVILITAMHGTRPALEGYGSGADDYVVKPFSPRELLARVRVQLRLRALTTTLVQAEKRATLGLMSAGVAHEIRNPVNVVINAVGPLRKRLGSVREGSLSEADYRVLEKLLGAVEESGRRIDHIVDSFLRFARGGPAAEQMNVLDPQEMIESALTLLSHRIDDGVTVHRDFRSQSTVLCTPELLSQALMNLLVNALDAMGPDGGNLHVSTWDEGGWDEGGWDEGGGHVCIAVRDDGPGIPPEQAARIFEPFYSTKPPGSGTGLGLTLAREIVERSGGTLELFDTGGAGTEFRLHVPDGHMESDRAADPAPSSRGAEA